jgi:hypothetical protein
MIANCNHMQSKVGATAACGNTQLCAGLQSGIEANLHAVRAIWPQSAGWLHDGSNEGDGAGNEDGENTNGDGGAVNMIAISNRTQNDDAGVDEDVSNSCYTPDSGYGAALFDARNAFNELNRYLMLWNVAHLWNRGSRFAFNRYRHWGMCLVRDCPG